MEVFRIVSESFSNALTSSGHANRWNYDDEFMLYTGSSRSLSSLELIVHENAVSPAFKYKVMVISIADDDYLYTQLSQAGLPSNWRSALAYKELRRLGSNWYRNRRARGGGGPAAGGPGGGGGSGGT